MLSSDSWILRQVEGVDITFCGNPEQVPDWKEIGFPIKQISLLNQKFQLCFKTMLFMKWNLKTARCYLMFFLEKKDGNQRMNLNLKHLKQNNA